jgi:hypothetical protein
MYCDLRVTPGITPKRRMAVDQAMLDWSHVEQRYG